MDLPPGRSDPDRFRIRAALASGPSGSTVEVWARMLSTHAGLGRPRRRGAGGAGAGDRGERGLGRRPGLAGGVRGGPAPSVRAVLLRRRAGGGYERLLGRGPRPAHARERWAARRVRGRPARHPGARRRAGLLQQPALPDGEDAGRAGGTGRRPRSWRSARAPATTRPCSPTGSATSRSPPSTSTRRSPSRPGRHLAAAGHHPAVVTGDGARGLPRARPLRPDHRDLHAAVGPARLAGPVPARAPGSWRRSPPV